MDSFAGSEHLLLDLLLGFAENPNLEIEAIRLAQIEIDAEGHGGLEFEVPGSRRGYAIHHARHNIRCIQEWDGLDVGSGSDLEKRLALMMCAERNTCDAFVTASQDVLRIVRRAHRACNAMSPREAFAVLGLHLRLRDDFVVHQAKGLRVEASGEQFYLDLGASLLTQLGRWLIACPRPEKAFDASPAGLTQAVVRRMARVLRARDRVHGHLFREASEASIDEAQFYFEGFLVALVGAFDAVARVAHSAYPLGNVKPSWRRTDWCESLVAAAPGFADELRSGTSTRAIIDSLFILRNLCHGEPMSLVGVVGTSDRFTGFRAAVPLPEHEAFARAINTLGGADAWSILLLEEGVWTLDLGRYVETMLPRAVEALNSLMRLTEVERFGLSLEAELSTNAEETARLLLLGGVS
jgi:hypothetical protein